MTDNPSPGVGLITTADSFDLGAVPEAVYQRAVQREKTKLLRAHELLDHVLVEGAHYGNPKLSNGRRAFQRPVLFLAGAEQLATAFRLQVCYDPDRPDVVVETSEYVSVTVHRALLDGAVQERAVDRTTASCTTREKRFRKADGTGYVFADAREALNDCWAMSEKRCKVRLVRSALGVTAFLASEEEMDQATSGSKDDDRPVQPWTDAERREVFGAAAAKGLTKKRMVALVQDTLGRDRVGTGPDVVALLAAIAALPAPGAAPKAEAAPAPADPQPHAHADDADDASEAAADALAAMATDTPDPD